MNSASPKPPRTTWLQITLRSSAVSAAALALVLFAPLGTVGLLPALFAFGFVAGALSRRQGWFSGLLVGLPMAIMELTQAGLAETHSFADLASQGDYWRLLVPASFSASALAVLGGIVGAWMQTARWQDK